MVTEKDNSISQQAKGAQIAHSLLNMIPCNPTSTINANSVTLIVVFR